MTMNGKVLGTSIPSWIIWGTLKETQRATVSRMIHNLRPVWELHVVELLKVSDPLRGIKVKSELR